MTVTAPLVRAQPAYKTMICALFADNWLGLARERFGWVVCECGGGGGCGYVYISLHVVLAIRNERVGRVNGCGDVFRGLC